MKLIPTRACCMSSDAFAMDLNTDLHQKVNDSNTENFLLEFHCSLL